MDRQVRDQILQMLEDTSLGIQNSKQAQDETLLAACVTAIEAVAEVCQNELSAARYAHYQDIFDGMTIAFQQSREAHMTADKLNEACDLSIELIQYVEKELKHDPEVKKEIVFLPYKASMWDSLESIWRAAAADTEHCNAYVVPLPYCDRNPNGTAKEWHCEINLFPKDVPVLDYRAVDLEKMHPDVIFIHNPYDDYNAATSVSSEYYSRNIKPYTDLLVYVPYFVSGDTIAPHFCQAPGIVNADKVIVESEIIKEQYERYYPGGNPPKDKFLALGSPKYDKVCGTTREDYVLPAKWQKLIGDKKVILYNTSITAMLQHADKFNAKLRYVFATFKKRDDVVLWWRPHPLLKAAMDSITPAVSADYHQIEQQYIDEGWGIYDDTSEMDRALVCTDAYYGDMSSLVWLYQRTGKPVMVENISGYDYVFSFYQGVIVDDCVYFMPLIGNFIGVLNLKTMKMQAISILDYDFSAEYQLFGAAVHVGEKIIFSPFRGNLFLEYNLRTRKQKVIQCAVIDQKLQNASIKFSVATVHGKNVFFGGGDCAILVVYNDALDEYHSIKAYYDSLHMYINMNHQASMQFFVGNILKTVILNTGIVASIDVADSSVKVSFIMNGFTMSASDRKGTWLVGDKSRKLVYMSHDGKVTSFKCPFMDSVEVIYRAVVYANGMLYFFVKATDMALWKFDIKKETFTKISKDGELGFVYGAWRHDNYVFFTMLKQKNSCLCFLDSVTDEFEIRHIAISEDMQIALLDDIKNAAKAEKSTILFETLGMYSANIFFSKSEWFSHRRQRQSEYIVAGKEIYTDIIGGYMM